LQLLLSFSYKSSAGLYVLRKSFKKSKVQN
jgi:hypothetical protein